MVKRRPAVAISPRLPHRDGLCAVVPLSTTPPARELPYVVHLRLATPLPAPFDAPEMWAKCDMVATVGFCRLDLFRTERDASGRRKYLQPKLDRTDFERIQQGVLAGLGLLHLTFRPAASDSC
jgi:uncharacterized protein YifN (PemK superfamily)